MESLEKLIEQCEYVKNWGHKDNLQGKLLSFVLNNTPSYMYDSSRTAVELGTKLFLNIEQGDDLNRLLVILPERFTTRFEMLKYKPERKVSQPNTSQSVQSNMSLAHYSGRPVPVSSASLTRSGSTIKSICQVETTIQYVNTDNLSANNGGHVSNQNLKTHHLSLTTKDDIEDDSVIENEVNYTTELPAVQNKDDEQEQKRLRRFSTRTRNTKPPVRYTDELNQSYLKTVKGEIRRKRESGYVTDTVVYQKRPSRRPRRTDTTMERLSQTMDVDPSDYRYGTDLDSVRATQSDVEVGGKRRKKSKRVRHEYDSSLIDANESIKLRLSRRNSSCELLTQDSVSHGGEALQNTESQENQGWGAIFSKLPVPRKTDTATLNGAGSTVESKKDKFSMFTEAVISNKIWTTALKDKPICGTEDEKRPIMVLFNRADEFMGPQAIRDTIKRKYPELFPGE
ncbi:hypothetical protein CBL_08833 [Carabus blaptoides fortunei]